MKKQKQFGFTLAELVVVISIIAILSTAFFIFYGRYRDKARYARTKKELTMLDSAAAHWLNDHGDYPPDVPRGQPSGLETYLPNGRWLDGPWRNSFYDWDNWVIESMPTYQVSLRFCAETDSEADCLPKIPAIFPTFTKYSAVYYCIDGKCRPSSSQPVDYPGLCINCNQDENAVLWGGE